VEVYWCEDEVVELISDQFLIWAIASVLMNQQEHKVQIEILSLDQIEVMKLRGN
jgi:hypothetical protein